MILDVDHATGDEICASCRHLFDPDEPYTTVEFGHINVNGAPVPVVELWCYTCSIGDAA